MDPATDAVLVERVQRGDSTAFAPLFERWYDRAYNVARGVVRRPELAADVTQDAFVAAWQQLDRLDDVNAFGGWLLRITRNRALDALRRERHSSATDDETVIALQDRGVHSPVAAMTSAGPAESAELHEREQLLWAAAAALGERDASLLDLHLRHGLTPAELAEDLGVTPNHAHQLVHRLRNRLGDAIGAFLLWNRGAPNCPALAGRTGSTFDADVAKVVKRHIRSCSACSDERDRQTDPTKMFAAVPFALAPLAFRARAAFALEQAGSPMPSELTSPTPQDPHDVAPRSPDSSPDSPPGRDAPDDDGPRHSDPDGNGFAPDPDAVTVRFDRRSDMPANVGPDWTTPAQPEHSEASRRRAVGRIAAVAALLLVLIGGSTALMLDAGDAPDGATSVIADDTPDDLAAAEPTRSSPPTSVAPTTTELTTTAPTTTAPPPSTTVPAPTTTIVPDPPVVVPPPPPPPPPAPPPPAPDPPAAPPAPPPPAPPDSTVPPPARPTVVRFTFRAGNQRCPTPTLPATALWSTDGADSAVLEWRGQTASVPVSGQRDICVAPGDTVVLTARNGGGEASDSFIF